MAAYIFDFDGTLVDSMPAFSRAILRTLDDFSVEHPDNVVEVITPMDTAGKIAYFTKLGVPADFQQALGKNLYTEYAQNIPAKESVIETLRELKSRGHSLSILTAGPHLTLDPCVKRLGLWELFDNVWSCDDFGTDKGNPEIFRMTAERLHCPMEDILFLDDSPKALRTAKAAGITACGVYDESAAAYETEMRELCDMYIHSFKELL